jgi:hypothetical protein
MARFANFIAVPVLFPCSQKSSSIVALRFTSTMVSMSHAGGGE